MLDPKSWPEFRALAHRILDDALDDVQGVAQRPAWQAVPSAVTEEIRQSPLPRGGRDLAAVYADYLRIIAPYTVGNRHPRFFGWVHGAGTPSGALAQLLMATLNINAGGREHAAVYIERKIIAWWAQIFGFPTGSSGIVTSGTSMATLLAVQVARTGALGAGVRQDGLAAHRLVAYAAAGTHHCVLKAFEVSGLGRNALRLLPVTADARLDMQALAQRLRDDRAAGFEPFMVVGTVGTVDIAAADDLSALAAFARAEALWLHVDGAFGALAILAPDRRGYVQGIEQADSLAIDFHKWLHVPYGTGLMLTRHAELHAQTFADTVPYLARLQEGTAGGAPWFCDYGLELSRGFGALSVWFAMEEFGLARLGASIEENCRLAARLGTLLAAIPDVVLAAPVRLNIVCARYAAAGVSGVEADAVNARIVVNLQKRGVAVPSTTRVGGRLVMRFNFTNHRTRNEDVEIVSREVEREIAAICKGAHELSD